MINKIYSNILVVLTLFVVVHLLQGAYMFSSAFFTGDIDGANFLVGMLVMIAICSFRFYRIESWKKQLSA